MIIIRSRIFRMDAFQFEYCNMNRSLHNSEQKMINNADFEKQENQN